MLETDTERQFRFRITKPQKDPFGIVLDVGTTLVILAESESELARTQCRGNS